MNSRGCTVTASLLLAAEEVEFRTLNVGPIVVDTYGQAILAAARVVRFCRAPMGVEHSHRPVLIEERPIRPKPRAFGHGVAASEPDPVGNLVRRKDGTVQGVDEPLIFSSVVHSCQAHP